MEHEQNMADDQTTIHELKETVLSFIREREWGKYNTPKDLALSISLEAAELLEHYQWRETHKDTAEVEKELADIIIYCLQFADKNGIDISTAVRSKMEMNRMKYPPQTKDLDAYLQAKQEHRAKNT